MWKGWMFTTEHLLKIDGENRGLGIGDCIRLGGRFLIQEMSQK